MNSVTESENKQQPTDPHKYNKLLYAEDAKHSDKPWEWWRRIDPDGVWSHHTSITSWHPNSKYSRIEDAPYRFIDFRMNLTDYSEDQRRQVQEWAFEQGYERSIRMNSTELRDIGWFHSSGEVWFITKEDMADKKEEVVLKKTLLTPVECGIQFKEERHDTGVIPTEEQKQAHAILTEINKWKPAHKLHPMEREQFFRILGALAYEQLGNNNKETNHD